MTTLNPIDTTEYIRSSYLRYLKTIYPFQNEKLRTAFWTALEEQERLIKGPLLESTPPFVPGRSIEQLVSDAVLHPGFQRLCSSALPWSRPLYLHQDRCRCENCSGTAQLDCVDRYGFRQDRIVPHP